MSSLFAFHIDISIYPLKFQQASIKYDIFVNAGVSVVGNFNIYNEWQLRNIIETVVTALISKLEISIFLIARHSLNVFEKFVTFDVSQSSNEMFEKSSDLQLLNIVLKFVHLFVTIKLVKLSVFNDLQFRNALENIVTKEVSMSRSILYNAKHPSNVLFILVGFIVFVVCRVKC